MKLCYADFATRAIADLMPHLQERSYLLTRINVPRAHRGQGHARRLLAEILKDADAEGATLVLDVSPSDGLNFDQLRAWYSRHGFEDSGFGLVMVRRPKA